MMRQHGRGLTLIELLITLAILGILLAMAWPSYSRHVQRAQRMEAVEALLSEAAYQEQLRAVSGQYQARSPRTLPRGRYQVTVVIGSQGRGYQLSATPLAAQQVDPCGELTLNDVGVQGSEEDPIRCWAGR